MTYDLVTLIGIIANVVLIILMIIVLIEIIRTFKQIAETQECLNLLYAEKNRIIKEKLKGGNNPNDL